MGRRSKESSGAVSAQHKMPVWLPSALISLFFAVVWWSVQVPKVQEWKAVQAYPRVTGVLESWRLEEIRHRKRSVAWHPDMRFSFEVEGKTYIGTELKPAAFTQVSRDWTPDALVTEANGVKYVNVYYNPSDPSHSFLMRGPHPRLHIGSWLPIVLSLGIAAASIGVHIHRRKSANRTLA